MMTHLRRAGAIAIRPGCIELLSVAALREMTADARY